MRHLYIAIIWCFCIAFTQKSTAQYTLQQLDNGNGLSNSCINTIYQDSDHIIWFGTWDGLNFYDGSKFHVFNYERSRVKGSSIASNVIYEISGDRHRNIWIGTVEGVSRFDKNSGNFSNYFYDPQRAMSNGYTVAVDQNGQIYAARRNSSQLYCYNPQTDAFEKVKLNGLSNFMLQRVKFDEQNNLWLLKDDGILECFKRTGSSFTKISQFASVPNVDNVMLCNHRLLYATKNNQLFAVEAGFKAKMVLQMPHELRAIAAYQNHYLFAWSSKGLGEYDQDFKPASFLSDHSPLIQNVRITALLNDASVLWLGTDGNGVLKALKNENYFGIIQKQANGQSFHIPVRAFCNVDNELWVGTKGNGIINIQNWGKKDVTFSNIKSFHTNADLLDNCVYAIVKGKDNLVYIGSDAPGITLYNQQKKEFIKWNAIAESRRYPAFGSVHCILYDDDGSVWLGLNESGLVHLKLNQHSDGSIHIDYLDQYLTGVKGANLGSNVIYSLARGSNNCLWVGCRYGGLSCFNKTTGKFKTFKAFSYNGSLSNNDVLSLYVDQARRLWVGTSFGLNWIMESEAVKADQPQFKKLITDDGLPNNTIHAITEDQKGTLWISTNKGLARINPNNLKIVQYKASDGLQSDEFSDNAVWKNQQGEIFFGGIYGFNYFSPDKIRASADQPHLLVSDLRFAGRTTSEKGLQVLTPNGPVTDQQFTLAPQDNYFELNIQPVTYINSQKCQYAFMLEGNDKEWHYIGNQEKIIYNNISPGKYTLKIKWSNGEGAWTKGISAFTVTVKQYFWLTGWAFVFYISVITGSAIVYLRYRKNKFVIQQELKMEHMLREKDEKIHQEQLDFFTNIAHELQTPLTLILGSLERYLYKSKNQDNPNGKYFLSVVKQEASRLHYLVLQLLEFRKAESGFLKNHFTYLDASDLLANISRLFTPLVENKSLNFTVHIEPGIQLWIDKDKLEKIMFNLLSNAFKHSRDKQSVILSVKRAGPAQQLEIEVSNSGCQLSGEDLDRLFDRFFVVNTGKQSNISSGIGLAFTRQLITLLNGKINVQCEDNWISFKVLLPLKYTPEHHELVADISDKAEKPSFIFKSINSSEVNNGAMASVTENNKRAIINSFEEDDKPMVLVVEDDERIRYLLKDILAEQYIVYEAATGKEAIELIHRITPNLIISDIMMPDLDGLQLCNIVKNTPATCHVPFVILSARGTIEQMTEGYECGADAYIPKPFQTEHLLVRVHKLLDYRQKLHQYFNENSSIKQIQNSDLSDGDKSFIEKVVKVIEDNLDEELDSSFLEQRLNMSKMQLYRKIKTSSDMTPSELIRQVRLQKSAILLRSSDLTVSEIFYRTGFNNKTYFFREFKKLYNCSPNAYRAQHRLPDLN